MIPSKGGLRLIPNGETVDIVLDLMGLALRADPARVEVKVEFEPRVNWIIVKARPIALKGSNTFCQYADLNGVEGNIRVAQLFNDINHYIKEC
jgi:hypothetical protein